MLFPQIAAVLKVANANVTLLLGATATLAWLLYRRYRASRELELPFLSFEDGDDSRQRYVTESGKLFKTGYAKVHWEQNAHEPVAPSRLTDKSSSI